MDDIEHCPGVIDAQSAKCPSPDAEGNGYSTPPMGPKASDPEHRGPSEADAEAPPKKRKKGTNPEQGQSRNEPQVAVDDVADPELAEEEGVSPEELRETLARPPPVNSGYLPLPWEGRLGYVGIASR